VSSAESGAARGRRDDGLRREVERDAQHVGVLDVEAPVLVEGVGLAPKGTADHLPLTGQASGAHAHRRDAGALPHQTENPPRLGNGQGALLPVQLVEVLPLSQ
jgi:hypothetical protein